MRILCRPVSPAVKLSRAARGQVVQPCLTCRNQKHSAAVSLCRIATTRAGLFRMQSRRARWRDLQPVNAARPSMTRRSHAATDPCSARRDMQIRPESRRTGLADLPYIYHVQRIASAIRGLFKRFSGTPYNCRTRCQIRPPGIDTLRICAVGVVFS